MGVLFKVKTTFADGKVVEDTVTNPSFKTAKEVEELYREDFGADLVGISVEDMRSHR